MDFEAKISPLLTPLKGKNPCGKDVRYEGTYDRLQQARLAEDDTLPTGVWQRELKQADWQAVEAIATEALLFRTKDLQVASWLTEAWTVRHGVEGLAQGLSLLVELSRAFWPHLYPLLRKEDPEYRLSPFFWLNEKIPERLLRIPLLPSLSLEPEDPPFFVYEWQSFQKKPTSELQAKIHTILGTNPRSSCEQLRTQTDQTLKTLEKVSSFLQSQTPQAEGILYKLKGLLVSIRHFSTFVLQNLPPDEITQGEMLYLTEDDLYRPETFMTAPNTSFSSSRSWPLHSREQAYHLLKEIADYLEKREPHSPTPYLIKRAVAWGHMNLSDLISEFSTDPSGLNQLTRLLGIDPSKKSSS